MRPEAGGGLEGRRAVVTGGSRGIGEAIARGLVGAGCRVLVCARGLEAAEALAGELREGGGEAWAAACDVADPASIDRLEEAAAERLGGVDILVNNAGIASSAPIRSQSLEEWERVFAVNVTGTFLCTQTFLPGMRAAGWGRVVNIASIAGRVGAPYIAAYAASKHAVVGLTRAVAAEVAGDGVTVNAVCPGYVDTPMTTGSVARIVGKTGLSEEEAYAFMRKTSPQGRLMRPEEVAFLAVALCDPRAGGINGQAIVLDGGGVQA
jgi:NAD(P)-dependent dehydrogenase (short-subunit alcohol dehydrogenase family)